VVGNLLNYFTKKIKIQGTFYLIRAKYLELAMLAHDVE
jgi:hypothetical protein